MRGLGVERRAAGIPGSTLNGAKVDGGAGGASSSSGGSTSSGGGSGAPGASSSSSGGVAPSGGDDSGAGADGATGTGTGDATVACPKSITKPSQLVFLGDSYLNWGEALG